MINEDRFDAQTTTVYLLKAEPIHDIIDFLSLNGHDLLDTITACCTTLGPAQRGLRGGADPARRDGGQEHSGLQTALSGVRPYPPQS